MKKTGFYIIQDRFFEDMPDPYLKGNKAGNRPHYYCFEDNATGIYWMIPLSSRIDKFRKIIEKKEQAGKPCDILHIVKLDDSRESVFLIQDMFPITEEYIERKYTIAGNHLMLTSEHTAKVIDQKAKKFGNVKAWSKVYAYTTGCAINIREIKAEKIVFTDSILALIIWHEKNIRYNSENMNRKRHKCVLKSTWIIPSAPEFE